MGVALDRVLVLAMALDRDMESPHGGGRMTLPPLPLTPGDQICLFSPGHVLSEQTGQTLTVIDVTPNSLTVETSDGDD